MRRPPPGTLEGLLGGAVIVGAVLAASCAPPPPRAETPAGAETIAVVGAGRVYRIVDSELGVVCYVYASGYRGGIDCLDILELAGDDGTPLPTAP